MATFYVLPPRAWLGQRLAASLGLHLPELQQAGSFWTDLADAVERACRHDDAYVVYREELPEDEEVARAVIEGFGAEPGDGVIEILTGQAAALRWRLSAQG
jgi:hypothetical protein